MVEATGCLLSIESAWKNHDLIEVINELVSQVPAARGWLCD